MAENFVDRSIVINAPASAVWKVLTDPQLTRQWIRKWWPDFGVLESDWKRGSSALWRMTDGLIGAAGTIISVDPCRSLSFSFRVSDPSTFRHEVLTYRLEEHHGQTKLMVSVGDFSDTPQNELRYSGTVESWNKSLPKIKELAEE